MAITLSFIILVWNSERFLASCLDSIDSRCRCEGIGYEIIAIDNGSTDGSSRIIGDYQRRYPEVFRTITLDRNRGTTYPRNLGLKMARGRFICILDSDTEMVEGSLSTVLSRLDSDGGIGIIAPRLILPDRTVQHSVKRFPTMLQKLSKLPTMCLGIPLKNYDFYQDFPFHEERDAESAISACWFLTAAVVEKVGHLDEKIFYSPEDLDYSMRVWKAGYRILYYPGLTVLHHTQQITHKKLISKMALSHFLGLLYYYTKHGGWLFNPQVGKVEGDR